MKIIGNTVGTPLPKPDWKQTDPAKGDYIKNKPEVIDPAVGQLLTIKTIDEDGHITELEAVNNLQTHEFITLSDIDEICGGVTEGGLMKNDVDELMAQLQ
jgi:hypothetical protein